MLNTSKYTSSESMPSYITQCERHTKMRLHPLTLTAISIKYPTEITTTNLQVQSHRNPTPPPLFYVHPTLPCPKTANKLW